MKKCLANARLVCLYARRFDKVQRSFIGPGSEKKWYSIKEDSPTRNVGQIGGKDVQFSDFAANQETIETIFRMIVFCQPAQSFTEQSKKYVKSMNPFTKERATCCDGTINRAQCDQDTSSFG